jgi:ABC-type dipeptide/oligopeptide/nickel transport system permease subunit
MLIFPGLAIVLAVLGFNLLGDGLVVRAASAARPAPPPR